MIKVWTQVEEYMNELTPHVNERKSWGYANMVKIGLKELVVIIYTNKVYFSFSCLNHRNPKVKS